MKKRRLVRREFGYSEFRMLFGLEATELFLNARYDLAYNELEVMSLQEYDAGKGDSD